MTARACWVGSVLLPNKGVNILITWMTALLLAKSASNFRFDMRQTAWDGEVQRHRAITETDKYDAFILYGADRRGKGETPKVGPSDRS
jgi:hypothetical protein